MIPTNNVVRKYPYEDASGVIVELDFLQALRFDKEHFVVSWDQ